MPKTEVVTVVQTEKYEIPAHLLNTDPMPKPPVANRQSEVSEFIAKLWYANKACVSQLQSIRELVTPIKTDDPS